MLVTNTTSNTLPINTHQQKSINVIPMHHHLTVFFARMPATSDFLLDVCKYVISYVVLKTFVVTIFKILDKI